MDVKRSAMPSSARVIDAARVILIFRHGFAQPHPSCDRFEPAELNRDEFQNLELPCRILVDDSQQLYFFRSHRQNQASPGLSCFWFSTSGPPAPACMRTIFGSAASIKICLRSFWTTSGISAIRSSRFATISKDCSPTTVSSSSATSI